MYKLTMILFVLGAISGCAEALVDAPSLNKRAFEISLAEMRVQSNIKDIGDSAIVGNEMAIDAILPQIHSDALELWDKHEKAQALFNANATLVQKTVNDARNSKFGSADWSAAQTSLSRLDRIRAVSVSSLVKIDKMVFNRLESYDKKNETDIQKGLSVLTQLQQRIANDVALQTRYIDSLTKTLAS